MSPSLTFTQALLEAITQARRALDPALHGRLTDAVGLVKDGRVFQAADGTWQVDSATRQGLVHRVNGTCRCEDAHFQAPQGLCKHRLSVYVARRVFQLMEQSPAPVVPEVLPEPWPENDIEPAPQSPPVETAPAPVSPAVPLPEAPASVNCHITLAGRQVQLTLRDSDEARLLQRLQAVLAQYPLPQPPPPPASQPQGQLSPQQYNALAMHRPITGVCAVHNMPMHWNEGKDGRKGWYSHRTDDGWCKGR